MNLLHNITAGLKSGLNSVSPNCRDASKWQSEALDHPLSPAKRTGLWLHLLICKWCRRYGRQIRMLRAAAHHHPDKFTGASPQTLSGEARARIVKKLRDDK
jgi:hypothetical protein